MTRSISNVGWRKLRPFGKMFRIFALLSVLLVPIVVCSEIHSLQNHVIVPNPNYLDVVDIQKAIQRAFQWLLTQRDTNWGWSNNTAKVLTTLQLITEDNRTTKSALLDTQLSEKQLQIELLVLLLASVQHTEYTDDDIDDGDGVLPQSRRYAEYALALSALCWDPRQFHSHDVIGMLVQQDREAKQDEQFAYEMFTVCSARAHLRKRHIRRLLDIVNGDKTSPAIDTLAMTLLTLRCVVKDHRHRSLQHSIRRPSVQLARHQLTDGSFGNLYSTALALQALQGLSDAHFHWNRSGAVRFMLERQDPDGAWTEPGLTADVLLALTTNNLGTIRGPPYCPDTNTNNHNDDVSIAYHQTNSASGSDKPHNRNWRRQNSLQPVVMMMSNATVTYTLWMGSNITENYTLTLTAPRNTSFYQIMQNAIELDEHYSFEASEWPNGHYVHTLAGYKEEPMGYYYWLLYRLPELPDPNTPPANQYVAPVGVDDLLIEDGDHFLYWYKKL